jgi:hypothetical protein
MPELIAVYPDGTITKEEITKIPDLDKLKDIVGGWIEMVPYFTTYKLPHFDLPYNPTATGLWSKAIGKVPNDHLVGGIAIVVGPKSFLRDM